MSFDRSLFPDPAAFFEAAGLRLTGRGKWRTTACAFHGGSDSMRVRLDTGAFVCMAGCGARGGDVLAYQMAIDGKDFVSTAKALGAWVDDGKPVQRRRPTPLPPRDALEVLAFESRLTALAAANIAHGVALSDDDRTRLALAAKRITTIQGHYQ